MTGLAGGVAVGVLGLSALDLFARNPNSDQAVGGAFGVVTRFLNIVISPAVPGVPDLNKGRSWGQPDDTSSRPSEPADPTPAASTGATPTPLPSGQTPSTQQQLRPQAATSGAAEQPTPHPAPTPG